MYGGEHIYQKLLELYTKPKISIIWTIFQVYDLQSLLLVSSDWLVQD